MYVRFKRKSPKEKEKKIGASVGKKQNLGNGEKRRMREMLI